MLAEAVAWCPAMRSFGSCGLSGANVDADASGLWLDGPDGNTCYDDPGETFSAHAADEVCGDDGASDMLAHTLLVTSRLPWTCLNGLCRDVSGHLDDASNHGLLLFAQLQDEPGGSLCLRLRMTPGREQELGGGGMQNPALGAILPRAWQNRPALVCDRDLAGDEVQTLVPNVDDDIQQVAASNVAFSCMLQVLRWREVMAG